ncbi:MAG: hypothetical protein KDJ16_17475 [Hyphomicrobiales bacterium]|nr:hypothetical protein [Hyphomicrobiales bacterium]
MNVQGRARTAVRRKKVRLSINERLASGGDVSVDEYAALRNECRATVYNDVKRGLIKITKRGRKSVITAADVLARRQRESGR